ncbi:MAG: sigma-54 interaction domain-containing protein, partial [Planctomycetota bacterium]
MVARLDPSNGTPAPEVPELVGRSAALARVLEFVRIAALGDYPVLVEGESGTGKELVARAIHRLSARSSGPFESENCGALPESLVESEFFGYEKGAFTGATAQKAGLFERARRGTIFLDEIGEMDLSTQRKLLRVLQEKHVRRVGGAKLIPVDFRVISATNRTLEDMVARGTFRKDLFYRLNVASICIPPLRDRPEDIPLLADHFNRSFAAEFGRPPLEFSASAIEAFGAYAWPGNVRELRNEILRLSTGPETRVDAGALSPRIQRGVRTFRPRDPRPSLFELEREAVGSAILAAIRTSNGNRAEAARKLGITRAALYRRARRYRLYEEPEWPAPRPPA